MWNSTTLSRVTRRRAPHGYHEVSMFIAMNRFKVYKDATQVRRERCRE
jgi:hypothetical protein